MTALRELAQQQETDITGRADRRAREEDELETVVYEMGQSLADCFYDAEQEDAATKVAPSRSESIRLARPARRLIAVPFKNRPVPLAFRSFRR
ncbi:hypothetical protein [Fuerstiella marisgermanici]|uniref:hypothetical protein n=1 Tax=Fuerstiella marisgermanici TaxID=1891926 RepID=UPI00097C258A|nr:hypothetical protein [Fuerstiella marisgermanici]